MNVFDELTEVLPSCTQCPLHLSRKSTVLDHINENSKVVFISDIPTEFESNKAKAFKGRSASRILGSLDIQISTENDTGELVTRDLDADDISYINLVRCRGIVPRGDLRPFVYECSFYTHVELKNLVPEIIVLLGKNAAKYFLGAVDDDKKTYVAFSKSLKHGQVYEGALSDSSGNPRPVSIVLGPSITDDDFDEKFKVINDIIQKSYDDSRTTTRSVHQEYVS